ncbi:MAG: hypothetical protein F6J98_07965 [Moorea sp. SIO4G2]|nr:hypothetical protein [Moorena sp. SIO4G2]
METSKRINLSIQLSAVSRQPSAYFIKKYRLRYAHAAGTVAWPQTFG